MKKHIIQFSDKPETIEGYGAAFTTQFVLAVRNAQVRGATLPPVLTGLTISEIRAYANAIPDSDGEASPVVPQIYGAQEHSYEDEVQATTAVKDKASGGAV